MSIDFLVFYSFSYLITFPFIKILQYVQVRRLRIQQRIRNAELGILKEVQENELPNFPSFIPFLPPLVSFLSQSRCILMLATYFSKLILKKKRTHKLCFVLDDDHVGDNQCIACRLQKTLNSIMPRVFLLLPGLSFLGAFQHPL